VDTPSFLKFVKLFAGRRVQSWPILSSNPNRTGVKKASDFNEFKLSLRGATGLAHDAVSTLLRLPVLTELDVSGCSRISAMDKMRLVAKVSLPEYWCYRLADELYSSVGLSLFICQAGAFLGLQDVWVSELLGATCLTLRSVSIIVRSRVLPFSSHSWLFSHSHRGSALERTLVRSAGLHERLAIMIGVKPRNAGEGRMRGRCSTGSTGRALGRQSSCSQIGHSS
jgi:hypothetical protein